MNVENKIWKLIVERYAYLEELCYFRHEQNFEREYNIITAEAVLRTIINCFTN